MADVAPFTTPDWVKNAIFYQIFPERFANGDPSNDPERVRPWGSPPTLSNFMGGDLQGIIDHLGYLAELGVNALYLNPIFQASSNHKYNTFDYYRIDPHFGTLETFRRLIDAAHARGIRVVLDGVFNHCGRGFFAFHSVCEDGPSSPYLNWFNIDRFPLSPYDERLPANYHCWWNIRSLPKLNTDHPPVRQFLLDVARYWIEQGADGWRLDVPNEIADHNFWRTFRDVVKGVNPDAYIVGEIWSDASAWLDGTQFDAVMNYLFRDLCRDYFARETLTVQAFATGIDRLLGLYPPEAMLAQLNLLGSHDTARILNEADGEARRLMPAVLFQMTFPGAPCIYYGDEIGLAGGKDPDCRRCFPWAQSAWNLDLLSWTRRCIDLRRTHSALRTGSFLALPVQAARRVYAFVRQDAHELCLVAINSDYAPVTQTLVLKNVPLAEGAVLTDLLSGAQYRVTAGQVIDLRLPPYAGVVLQIVTG